MSNIAIIEKFYHAIATGEAETLLALVDDAFELVVPGNDGVLHGHYRGKQAFMTQIFPTVFSGVNPTQITFCKNFKIVSADGENVTALTQNDGLALSGKAYNQLYGHIFRIKNGKIIRLIEFYDGLLAQNVLWQDTPPVPPSAPFTLQAVDGIERSNTDLALQFIAHWENKDLEAILDAMTNTCFYHNIPLPACTGKDDISAFIAPVLDMSEQVEWEVHHISENAEGFVMTERTDKFLINGYWVCLPVMGSMKFENGLLSVWRDYFDLATFESEMAKAQT
ncbi:MAG: nuclear transport factor 2 family protein [Parvibaculales bacterium]